MPPDHPPLAIDLQHVEKVYRGRVHALRGIEMRVHAGEIFGLLGPNGAGKSTLVKIMMTVVRPTSAQGSLLGKPIGDKPTLARVGYLPEHHRLPSYLTGRQVLHFYAALSKVNGPARKRRAGELLEAVGMTAWADKKVTTYSKGMMQRIGVAQALMNDPALLVLDEPTDGVDPVGRREIRDLLLKQRQLGRTIFINSHLLSELEMVSDRVAILVQGRVAAQGTLEELTARSQRYEIIIEGSPPAWALNDASINVEGGADGQFRLTLQGAEPAPAQALIDRLRREERVIISMRPIRETLEDLFMRAVTDPATGRTRQVGAAPPMQASEAGRS